jgi:autophagy-related protein 2
MAQGPGLSVQMTLRGVVILVLPTVLPGLEAHAMTEFFSRPLIPPRLPQSYLRVHLEHMSVSMLPTQSSSASSAGDTSFTLGEVSAFVFHQSTTEDTALSASPLLITDHHLCTQYPPSHIHPDSADPRGHAPLPSFELSDWTDAQQKSLGMKVSHWRTKVKPKYGKSRRESRMGTSPSVDPAPPTSQSVLPPAISLTAKQSISKRRSPPSTAVEIVIEPLHVFLDLDLATTGLLAILDELADQRQFSESEGAQDDFSSEDSDEETPPASPHSRKTHSVKDRERERRRLEKMVLEDLDLHLDYRPSGSSKNRSPKMSKVSSEIISNVFM